MSLLNLKKKTVAVVAPEKKKPAAPKKLAVRPVADSRPAVSSSVASGRPVRDVLLRPRVTEKGHLLAEKQNVYLFEVSRDATSRQISDVCVAAFKVRPLRVSLLPIRRKQVFVRGKWGWKGGGKKAYVYLKEGDKIEVV